MKAKFEIFILWDQKDYRVQFAHENLILLTQWMSFLSDLQAH